MDGKAEKKMATEADAPADVPTVSEGSLTSRLRDLSVWADWAAVVGLVVLVIVFGALDPTFLSLGNIQSVLLTSAIPIVLAIGQSFVVATAGIHLSVASCMT